MGSFLRDGDGSIDGLSDVAHLQGKKDKNGHVTGMNFVNAARRHVMRKTHDDETKKREEQSWQLALQSSRESEPLVNRDETTGIVVYGIFGQLASHHRLSQTDTENSPDPLDQVA